MKKNHIVVTGTAGFLGGRTAKFLASAFSENVIVATSRRTHRKHELEQAGCVFEAGDLESPDFCQKITQNASIVIHCAALSSPWGNYQDFYRANVLATQNLLQAAMRQDVERFIFVSTPSIYFNFQERFNVREDEPLPEKMVNHYAQTKLQAEKIVLEANGNGIYSIAIRPRAIIGAEDTVIFPRVLEAYRQGKLKIVGDGKNIVDLTCVSNVIEAIVCCINAPINAYGEAYNITNGKATALWEALGLLFQDLGLELPKQRIPKKLALLVATLLEWKSKLFSPNQEPALTKYGIGVLADSFTLDISKAKEKLGYQPKQSTQEGIKEFVEWYKTH